MPADEILLPKMFADAGYRCGLVGKLHLASCSDQKIEARIDGMWEFYKQTNIEDIVACEAVQEGVKSRMYQGGRMSFRFEETIHRFQNMVADHMIGAPTIPPGDDIAVGGYAVAAEGAG